MDAIDIPSADVQGTIGALWIFPIKSCAGIAVPQARLLPTGLEWDRAWMVVDGQGQFVTQRQVPHMVLVQPRMDTAHGCMHMAFPGLPDCQVPLALPFMEPVQQRRVKVWHSEVLAWDCGDRAAHWMSQALGLACRLVRFDPASLRLANVKWTGGIRAPNQFADGYPLLVSSQAAIHALNTRLQAKGHAAVDGLRFRANIVLEGVAAHEEDFIDELWVHADEAVAIRLGKPCTRCPIPDIDPQTGKAGTAIGDELQRYRQDARMGGAITFGMNAVVAQGAGNVLRVGQAVSGILRFDDLV